ncbi:hypothetical protein WG66_005240 [Moniliophthora roreri]|nr:hypothetical protein WG66_005240 [Moniliophthora roreri]
MYSLFIMSNWQTGGFLQARPSSFACVGILSTNESQGSIRMSPERVVGTIAGCNGVGGKLSFPWGAGADTGVEGDGCDPLTGVAVLTTVAGGPQLRGPRGGSAPLKDPRRPPRKSPLPR